MSLDAVPPWMQVVLFVAALVAVYLGANRMSGSAGRTASAAEVTSLAGRVRDQDARLSVLETEKREAEADRDAAEDAARAERQRAQAWAVFSHALLRYVKAGDLTAPMPEVPEVADPWTGVPA